MQYEAIVAEAERFQTAGRKEKTSLKQSSALQSHAKTQRRKPRSTVEISASRKQPAFSIHTERYTLVILSFTFNWALEMVSVHRQNVPRLDEHILADFRERAADMPRSTDATGPVRPLRSVDGVCAQHASSRLTEPDFGSARRKSSRAKSTA